MLPNLPISDIFPSFRNAKFFGLELREAAAGGARTLYKAAMEKAASICGQETQMARKIDEPELEARYADLGFGGKKKLAPSTARAHGPWLRSQKKTGLIEGPDPGFGGEKSWLPQRPRAVDLGSGAEKKAGSFDSPGPRTLAPEVKKAGSLEGPDPWTLASEVNKAGSLEGQGLWTSASEAKKACSREGPYPQTLALET